MSYPSALSLANKVRSRPLNKFPVSAVRFRTVVFHPPAHPAHLDVRVAFLAMAKSRRPKAIRTWRRDLAANHPCGISDENHTLYTSYAASFRPELLVLSKSSLLETLRRPLSSCNQIGVGLSDAHPKSSKIGVGLTDMGSDWRRVQRAWLLSLAIWAR